MLTYEEFESRLLAPRIYGRTLRLMSSIVLLIPLIGFTLIGIVGARLTLLVVATIRMLIEELRIMLPEQQLDDAVMRHGYESGEQEHAQRTDSRGGGYLHRNLRGSSERGGRIGAG